jgi:hypothetical protein
MDMLLLLFPLKRLEMQGLNESTLGDDVRACAKTGGVNVQAGQGAEPESFYP